MINSFPLPGKGSLDDQLLHINTRPVKCSNLRRQLSNLRRLNPVTIYKAWHLRTAALRKVFDWSGVRHISVYTNWLIGLNGFDNIRPIFMGPLQTWIFREDVFVFSLKFVKAALAVM